MSSLFVIFATILVAVNGQRSPYAGARPNSGYKDTYLPQSTSTSSTSDIGNRDGELGQTQGSTSSIGTTTDRLPYDAYGDAAIVNHYNSLPFDQRPYWIVNQQHIETQRGTPTRRPAMGSTSQTSTNGQSIGDRFNEVGQQQQQQLNQQQQGNQQQMNQQQPNQQQSNQQQSNQQQQQAFNPINNQNVVSLQEVVYPSNITPEQRLDMEIRFLQQRLELLLEQRRQLQAQRGQQTTPNLQNSQSRQRNF